MRISFLVTADIDSAGLEFKASKFGMPLQKALESILSEVENKIGASLFFMDTVENVQVKRTSETLVTNEGAGHRNV